MAIVSSGHPTEILHKRLGGGAQSDTYLTHRLNPDKDSPEKGLVKVSEEHVSYSPQEKVYKKAGGNRGLDPVLATATTTDQPKRRHILFGVPADGDVTKIKWNELEQPASEMFSIFKDCVYGLWKLHRKDILHRDMKGPNILYKLGQEEKASEGKITDYGSAKEAPQPKREKIRGPLEYLPGFVFEAITDQRVKEAVEGEEKIRSYGIQTKKADVFSLGYALQKDFLLPAIFSTLQKESINAHLPVTFKRVDGPFTDERNYQKPPRKSSLPQTQRGQRRVFDAFHPR